MHARLLLVFLVGCARGAADPGGYDAAADVADGSIDDGRRPEAATDGCVPDAATACSKRCGPVPDGCGGTVECSCPSGQFCGRASTCQSTRKVWDIAVPDRCYEQDLGHVVRQPWMDRWLMYYGAVTDKLGVHTCSDPGYSEDIWATWSATDGVAFGQTMGVAPPVSILTSQDLATRFGRGAGGCPTCTGWHIGDPTVARGNKTGTWYMFFDTQSCADLGTSGWSDLVLATSDDPFVHWQVRSRIRSLPGTPPFSLPRLYADPSDGRLYLLYNDPTVTVRAAELIDDGTGLTFVPLGNVVPSGAADVVSPFKIGADYYAVADNFGAGKPSDLNTLWLLGPSSSPVTFDWSKKTAALRAGDWFGARLWAPSALGPDDTGDGTIRVYFWGAGPAGACNPKGSVQAGLAVY